MASHSNSFVTAEGPGTSEGQSIKLRRRFETSKLSTNSVASSRLSLHSGLGEISLTATPLYVRIGSLLSPAVFRVSPVQFAGDSLEGAQSSKMKKLFDLETSLSQLYHQERELLNPPGAVRNPRQNMHVAVRRDFQDNHWYRGQIRLLVSGRTTKAKVYLIDYGETTDPVPLITHVRLLPKKYLLTLSPMAFEVQLAGLRPISLNIDYDMGMTRMAHVVTNKYSASALDLIRKIIRNSGNRLAEIRNWKKDPEGRIHGSVFLKGFYEDLNLAEILTKGRFASFSQATLFADIKGKSTDRGQRKLGFSANLSIAGGGSVRGIKTLDDTVAFTEMDLSKLDFAEEDEESDFDYAGSVQSEEVAGPPDIPSATSYLWRTPQWTKPIISVPSSTKTSVESRRPSTSSSISSIEPPFAVEDEALTPAQKLCLKLRGHLPPSAKKKASAADTRSHSSSIPEEPVSMWDSFRQDSAYKDETSVDPGQPVIMVPAGMDTGKFIEEAVKFRAVSDGVGPKKIIATATD